MKRNQPRTGVVMATVVILALVTAAVATSSTPAPPCERAPANAQPADAFYRLGIAGEPDLFLPGELYTVSLQGVDSGQGPTPFVGFSIWAEIDEEPKEDALGNSSANHSLVLGAFQAYDAHTKPHEFCKPSVVNATAHPKTEIQVIWSAPMKAIEICVRLCARATGTSGSGEASGVQRAATLLARKICAAPAAPASFARQPPIVEPCCACDEAKYEVTFEGLWSRNTHPNGFPPETAQAHFGDVIGASHTAQYRVWQEGRVATAGLRRLADDGATTALEKELKAESDHIRTIIKARGISWQQVAGSGTPNTFAVFRVDAKNHLVSLASKLWPSPDWIVGVSALELCNANCTWSRSATLPLYPYDAGTDSGIAYTSRRLPTVPAAPVRALRPDWPRDPRSPFYSAGGEMRPFARLRLTRLQLFEKNCEAIKSSSETAAAAALSRPDAHAPAGGGACATHAWGGWSACSATCGPGRAVRQRQYVWPARAHAEACRVALSEYRRCRGPRLHCRAVSEYEPEPAESTGPCAMTAWSEWSPCEGCGVRARTRHYAVQRAHKRCHVGFRARAVTSQAMPCEAGPCHRPPNMINATNSDWFYVDQPSWPCKVSPWGEWSPCSARCGRGRRLRTRVYLSQDTRVQQELSRRLLDQWNRQFAEWQQLEIPPDNTTGLDPEIEELVQDQLEKCQFTLSQQEALCDGEGGDCLNATMVQEICKQPFVVGHCRGYEERWFFNSARGSCEPFGFSGCGGNGNNFRTRELCLKTCGADNRTTAAPATTVSTATRSDTIIKKLKPTPTPSSEDNEVIQNDAPAVYGEEVTKCKIGPWLGWSNCFGECGFGVKLNYRLVKNGPPKLTKQCKRLVKSRTCNPDHCGIAADHVVSATTWPHANSLGDHQRHGGKVPNN